MLEWWCFVVLVDRTMATSGGANLEGRLGKLAPDDTVLFVCDVQERFRSVISGYPAVVDVARRMVCMQGLTSWLVVV